MRRPTTHVSLSRTKSPVPAIRDENTTGPNQQQAPQCKSPSPTPSYKESRAFEHDRQRLKKAAGLLARKVRKAEAKTTHVLVKPQQQSVRRGGVGVHVHVHVDDRDDQDELAVEENEVEWGEARSLSLRLGPDEAQREREGICTGVMHRAEVALSDLLIARKPRRGREQDFEVVPPLRSVIVLDDISPELDFDEPWEHVYPSDADDDDTHCAKISYAKIAALN